MMNILIRTIEDAELAKSKKCRRAVLPPTMGVKIRVDMNLRVSTSATISIIFKYCNRFLKEVTMLL